MLCISFVVIFALVLVTPLVTAKTDGIKPENDNDLDIFVTRPDLRPPKFHVEVYEPDFVSPGYWFVAPYSSLQKTYSATLYQPSQTGPHIYDGSGNLVWSGAHLLDPGRPALDFRAININGTSYLSMLVLPHMNSDYHPEGVGLILDSSFTAYREVNSQIGLGVENMHEFNIIENGQRALMITYQNHAATVELTGVKDPAFLSVGNPGFVEVDINTGRIAYEWWSNGRIHTNETSISVPWGHSADQPWDWLHLNSVDKDVRGDYLISGRYTDTIYKISGADGSIIWRLGGKLSSFKMSGFNFSAQHDARFRNNDLDLDYNATTTFVSFMDNGAGGGVVTSNFSMGLVVALNTETMTASLVKKFVRPDNGRTIARGNFQVLPNSNVLAGWSENAYCTEFTADGRRVLETNFTSQRMVTYRAYKYNFISNPSEDPVMKGFVFGESPETSTSTFYISWNGATEVSSWNFFAKKNLSDQFSLVGAAAKTGFETTFMTFGYYEYAYSDAIASDGATVLGRSLIEPLKLPFGWQRSDESRHKVNKISPPITVLQAFKQDDINSATDTQRLIEGSTSWNEFINSYNYGWVVSNNTWIVMACVMLSCALFFLITSSRARRLRVWSLCHGPRFHCNKRF